MTATQQVKLTAGQRRLLRDVGRGYSDKVGGWHLRDMRRNAAGIALERLGLVERDWPEPTGFPGKNRIRMRLSPAGQALEKRDL